MAVSLRTDGDVESAASTPAASNILVVDDEDMVRDVVVRYLEHEGMVATQAADGEMARQLIEHDPPDLVVLDVMVPHINGLDLCSWIRSRSEIPVILLMARGEESDRITGLELGADDYVVKPFSPRELVIRIKAILRRTGVGRRQVPQVLEIGVLTIDGRSRRVLRNGSEITLTATEFDLLFCLASHPHTVFSGCSLLAQVWRYEAALDAGTSTVTVHVRRLREKIEDDPSDPQIISTIWGVGYRFDPVTMLGAAVGIGAILVGTLAAFVLRTLRSVRLQLVGLALVAVILPLGAVLVSGLVMFHMGNDADFIFITGAVTSIGLLGAFLLARNLVDPLETIRKASHRLAAGDLSARAPEGGPAELAELGTSFNLMAAHLEEAFDARRELVAWASHDLRAPITSLQAMLGAIEDGIVEPAHDLSPLQSQVRLLGALVDDLFDLACIDSGAVNLEYDVVEMEALVSSCVHRFDAEARAREIRVMCLRRGGPTQSRCAPDKVERVLTNLLTNALRYTPSGGSVAVTVAGGAGAVFVSVEDTGIGIAPEVTDRVFEPFWRADGARTSAGGGAGLGLAIARGLIEAQGGRIWAEPPPRGGTRVSFVLPASPGEDDGQLDPNTIAVARAYFTQDPILGAGPTPGSPAEARSPIPLGADPITGL